MVFKVGTAPGVWFQGSWYRRQENSGGCLPKLVCSPEINHPCLAWFNPTRRTSENEWTSLRRRSFFGCVFLLKY
jgi:hypothetical protein